VKRRLWFPAFLVGVLALAVLSTVGRSRPADAVSAGAAGGPSESSATLTVAHVAASSSATAKATTIAKQLEATFTTAQKKLAVFSFTSSKRQSGWSNLPVTSNPRAGVAYADMTTKQKALFIKLAKATMSAKGYKTFAGIRAADDYLNTLQSTGQGGGPGTGSSTTPNSTTAPGGGGTPPSGTMPSSTTPGGGGASTTMPDSTSAPAGTTYNSGNYYVSIYGTPSTSKKWALQFTGHHLGVNTTFAGSSISGTPYFTGVEPKSFTQNGTTYAPINAKASAMFAMIDSLSTAELATAKLSGKFDDVLLGPEQDGKFPTRQGVLVSALSTKQRALVTKAITQWVQDQPTAAAKKLLATYTSQYAKTKIAYATATTPKTEGAYVRIDGPRVWIEIACQAGVVTSQIHYHTMYRDHTKDYGG
jgi:hypothetical protein